MMQLECPDCDKIFVVDLDRDYSGFLSEGDVLTCTHCKAKITISLDFESSIDYGDSDTKRND